MFCMLLLKCCFTSSETLDLLGTGAQDGHLCFHTAPVLCNLLLLFRPCFPEVSYVDKWINTCLVYFASEHMSRHNYYFLNIKFWVCVWSYSKSLSSSNFWLLVCGWPLGNFLVSGPVPLDWFFCWRKYYIETAGQKRSHGEGLLDQGKFLVPSHHSCMTTECS